MGKILKKLMVLLDAKQKSAMVGLIVLMLIGAVLEACSIAIIIPVIKVVIQPDAVSSGGALAFIYNHSFFTSEKAFSVAIMLSLIIAFIVKNLYLFFEQKLLYRFIFTNQFRTSERMMKNYMRRDYEFFLNADTAVIQRSITSDVNNMYALIQALLQLTSEIIVFVSIAIVCLVADPLMTLIIAALLGVTLIVIKVILKPILYRAGAENQEYYSGLFKWISQTVTGVKEVKVNGREKYFIDEYIKCGRGYVGAVQKYTLINKIITFFQSV